MRRLLTLGVMLAVPLASLSAQATPAEIATWDSVFHATYAAYDARDWAALARIVDRRDLDAYGADVIRMFERMATNAEPRSFRAQAQQLVEEWRRLPSDSVFARFMRESHGHLDRVVPGKLVVTRDIVGHVTEGDSLAHVVFRSHVERLGRDAEPVSRATSVLVFTLRRTGDQWHATLNDRLAPSFDMVNAVQ